MAVEPSGRYKPSASGETLYQPGSGDKVLLNKLGIKRKREMDLAEFEALVRIQHEYLGTITDDTRFTAELIRRMHRDWLGEIYSWAGEYRTVNLAKGGFAWPPALQVPQNMEDFEQGLLREHTPCKPGSIQEVAQRIAVVHAELLFIHPFRDGNGRLARWLADFMAAQAGYSPPVYPFAGPKQGRRRQKYIEAVQAGYLRNYSALEDFFAEGLERALEEEG